MAAEVTVEIFGHPDFTSPVTLPVGGKLAFTHNFNWHDDVTGATVKQTRKFTFVIRDVK